MSIGTIGAIRLPVRRSELSIVAIILTGCTSVTRVGVAPDQLRTLAGIGPDEERGVIPRGETQMITARGTDPLRLEVRPEWHAHAREQPWGQLSTLRWGPKVSVVPTVAPGEGAPRVHTVPVDAVMGGEIEVSHPDALRTSELVLGVVLGVAVVGLAALLGTGYLIGQSFNNMLHKPP
jgi:hypothetical protein